MVDRTATDRAAIDAGLTELTGDIPAEVPERVRDAMRYALSSGGKRLRGLLVLAAYRACGGRQIATPLALSVEVIHAYSLIHDDLPCMDDDDMRRGRPTVHRAFDAPTATLAGLLMIPLAARTAYRGAAGMGLTPDVSRQVVGALMIGAGGSGMVAGQLLDLEAERVSLSLEALEIVHRSKTGALIAAAARMGGIAAGATPAMIDALGSYGSDMGLAFQIVDDVLDLTASAEALGKTVRRDEPMGKSTHPALLGTEGSRLRARALVERASDTLRHARVRSDELDRLAQYAALRTT